MKKYHQKVAEVESSRNWEWTSCMISNQRQCFVFMAPILSSWAHKWTTFASFLPLDLSLWQFWPVEWSRSDLCLDCKNARGQFSVIHFLYSWWTLKPWVEWWHHKMGRAWFSKWCYKEESAPTSPDREWIND